MATKYQEEDKGNGNVGQEVRTSLSYGEEATRRWAG